MAEATGQSAAVSDFSLEMDMKGNESPELINDSEAVEQTHADVQSPLSKSLHPNALHIPEEENREQERTLDQLPAEMLLHIFSFIEARIVITRLSLVCRSFYELLSDTVFWKVRIKKRWPKKYPAIPVLDSKFNWRKACIEREEQHAQWSTPETTSDHITYLDGIFSPVDVVHLMQEGTKLAVGSRDRYLNLIDTTKLDVHNVKSSSKEAKILSKMDAHAGWIWSMASLDNVLATGSWDMYIKLWDMEAGGQVLRKVKCKSAVLDITWQPDLMVAGAYDKKVYHIDPRAPVVLAEKRYHRKPVLCVSACDNFIVTGSEDSTIVVYDKRADSVLKTLQLPAFPMSMSYNHDQVWVGDKRGLVHLIDATDGDFDIVETYNVGHTGKVTDIQYTLGALYTCSTDRTVRIHEPTAEPTTITTLKGHKAEVASIQYSNGILVSGSSDGSVGIWKPKAS